MVLKHILIIAFNNWYNLSFLNPMIRCHFILTSLLCVTGNAIKLF